MTTRVLGYCRVSTSEQAASGLGLDAQRRAIELECERRGWQLAEIVADEGESGKSLDRPGLRRALQRLVRGEADVFMASRLDRVSRSVGDFAALLEWFSAAGLALVALDVGVDTSTPGGRLVANVFASVSEWERDTIAARTRDGLASLRAQGRPAGRPAVIDRPALAERIRSMREAGMTYQAIADALNAEGIPTLRGGAEWRVSAVQAASGYHRPPAAAGPPTYRPSVAVAVAVRPEPERARTALRVGATMPGLASETPEDGLRGEEGPSPRC
jgi:DNA invertase Pin-like site-specific DNA recombinase